MSACDGGNPPWWYCIYEKGHQGPCRGYEPSKEAPTPTATETAPLGHCDTEHNNIQPYPHGISCPQCREHERCNYCGQKAVTVANGRCTNGRCVECCHKHCLHTTR
jgi:hypothetical protein